MIVLRPLLIRSNFNVVLSSKQLKILEAGCSIRAFKTVAIKPKQGISKMKIALLATLAGVTAGTGYSVYKSNQKQKALLNPHKESYVTKFKTFPNVKISKEIRFPTDSSGLDLTLFQYATCPFCCKVRAFLDFYGISYNLVEVDSVFRQQLKWTDYKKVPIVLVKVGDNYIQLNDSSMIISALTTYLKDREVPLEEVSNFYPSISYADDDGNVKKEILNRYYLMFQKQINSEDINKSLEDERKWRKWADDVLVHMLSPNVYRNTDEALQAFRWFSEVGDWNKNFNAIETQCVIYLGAFAMWMIGKRLKKRHHLKDDVRVSLYDETNKWLRELKRKGNQFHGGKNPDLADLAVFGVLNSIEGCLAFKDLLLNTKIGNWYSAMKEQISRQGGTPLLVHS